MANLLIRGLTTEAVARIDDEAAAQGLSRNEYLRRSLERDAVGHEDQLVTLADLRRASEATRDLMDDDVMRKAWS